MKKNKRYARHSTYNNFGKEKGSSKPVFEKHKLYYIKGKHNFGGLEENLIKYQWSKIYESKEVEETLKSKDLEKAAEKESVNDKILKDLEKGKKTIVYKTNPILEEQAMAVMYLDRKNHYHEVDILVLGDYLERNPEIIWGAKLMFERELKCKLEDREIE